MSRMSLPAAPTISVIMGTYNGARTVRHSINSILSQTWRDLEMIVIDDCSTDATVAVLESIDDARLTVLRNPRNLGVVATRNRCLALARGEFVALLDHDDLSAPTRIAKQLSHLRQHPGTVLVGTAANVLQDGQISAMTHPRITTPGLILWLLHIANPLICSSVMFRAAAASRLGAFMRESYTYADDYDFYHRMAALGEVTRLDEVLTIYRLHASNTYKQQEQTMAANAVKVLLPIYRPLFGEQAGEAAELIVRHLSAGHPVPDMASLHRVRQVFDALNRSFLDRATTDLQTREALLAHARVLWHRMLRATARQGGIGLRTMLACRPAGVDRDAGITARVLLDGLPMRGSVRDMLRRLNPAPPVPPVPPPGRLFGTIYEPRLPDPAEPPTLFVVVDTEAEFEWTSQFTRELTSVSAMDDIGRGQAIFDAFGLRPIYVIDFPVATQDRGYHHLREILARDGCAIGAHLHPWTTPPFEETLSPSNSYPGNLDPRLEDRKLETLIAAIRENLGVSPVFYKAGRYGFGPATATALARHGIRIDLSVLPGADLRPRGGPDFRRLQSIPYRIAGTDILSLPMSRAHVGLVPALGAVGARIQNLPRGALLHVPALLARLGLAETLTLTPEGVTGEEQIRLIRAMLARGHRQFVLHYHSPSLSPGHTPYVRDQAGAESVLDRLRQVCRFFFEDLGGLPGYPGDLLQVLAPSAPRQRAMVRDTAHAG